MIKLIPCSLLPVTLLALFGCGNTNNAWCPPEKNVTPEPVKLETLTLSADALFQFDQFTLSGLLPEDKARLDNFTRKVKENTAHIDSLTVVGHTDRLGPDEYNYTLSLKRAGTVKELLEGNEVTVPVKIQSMGKHQPVTTHCEGKGALLKMCLQPDRRVEIIANYK